MGLLILAGLKCARTLLPASSLFSNPDAFLTVLGLDSLSVLDLLPALDLLSLNLGGRHSASPGPGLAVRMGRSGDFVVRRREPHALPGRGPGTRGRRIGGPLAFVLKEAEAFS